MYISVYDFCSLVENDERQIIHLIDMDIERRMFSGKASEAQKSKYAKYRVDSISASGYIISLKIYKS